MPAQDTHTGRQLAARDIATRMHEDSIHLWNALEREYDPGNPGIWAIRDLREDIEGMQALLEELSEAATA